MKYKIGDIVQVIDTIGNKNPLGFISKITNIHEGEPQHLTLKNGKSGLYSHRVRPATYTCTCGVTVCSNCRQFRRN